MIRVLVAEDQALIRESFARLIDSHPEMTVIAAVNNGAAAVASSPGADVVVMDIRMPIMDGISAARKIVQSTDPQNLGGGHGPRVLMLTTFREEHLVLAALEAGAAGFLLKDSHPRELLSAIDRIHRGEAVLDPKITPIVLRHIHAKSTTAPSVAAGTSAPSLSGGAPPHLELAEFTPREREILTLVCRGLSNDEIAGELTVAVTTVKTHVKSLLTKTGTRGRVELVIWAARRGLLGDH